MEEDDKKIDYKEIGLKAGLEIHQQLDTGKLFCRCPGYLRSDEPHFIIKRKLHAVAGESGEIDEAVRHEANLNREFIYEGYRDSTCLIELDEEPPKEINQDALNEALKIALLLNCEIYQNTQIMRKTVIDGSNTSGFQRTLLLAHDGFVEISSGKVGIATICLEEDAARIVKKNEKSATFRLDRLGIPLIEIATKPELDSPERVKECALKIGEILRACKVKRGIGTIRQDLNISISGHNRVEIKGFQEPRIMIETVIKEIKRQEEELKKGKKNGEVRNAKEDGSTEFLRPMPGSARMYPETDLPLLKISRDKINEMKKNLPKLRGEIRGELKKKGLDDEMINLVLDGNLDEFNVLMNVYDKDANLIAKMIALWRNEFASKMKISFENMKEILSERLLEEVLENVAKGNIKEGDVKRVLWEIVNGKKLEDSLKTEKMDDNLLEEQIRAIMKEKPGLRTNAYMGLIIAKLGTGIDKKKAMEILNRVVG